MLKCESQTNFLGNKITFTSQMKNNKQIKKESKEDHVNNNPPIELKRSKSILSDIRNFFLCNPGEQTLIQINSVDDRYTFNKIIHDRVGIGVEDYQLLNMHRIHINAPSEFVFKELLSWDGDSSWWPNHIARANLQNGKLEKIKITLLGLSNNIFKLKNGLFGYHLLHLFNLNAIKFQKEADENAARYLLYSCSGGYPIGVFCLYVRDSNTQEEETGLSQLFAVVSFNFYGKRSLSNWNILRKGWEKIHNKVTSNVLYRIKLISERDYASLKP